MSKHLVQHLVDVVVMHSAFAIGVATSLTGFACSGAACLLGIASGGATGIDTSPSTLVVELVGRKLLGATGAFLKRML